MKDVLDTTLYGVSRNCVSFVWLLRRSSFFDRLISTQLHRIGFNLALKPCLSQSDQWLLIYVTGKATCGCLRNSNSSVLQTFQNRANFDNKVFQTLVLNLLFAVFDNGSVSLCYKQYIQSNFLK